MTGGLVDTDKYYLGGISLGWVAGYCLFSDIVGERVPAIVPTTARSLWSRDKLNK